MARTFASKKERAALGWYDCGSFRDRTHPEAITRPHGERGFELKLHETRPNDPLSPFYLMLRTEDNPGKPGPLTPEIVADSAAALHELTFQAMLPFDCVCGLPNAGEPFTRDILTLNRSKGEKTSLLRLRKEEVGGKRQVVGPPKGEFTPGQTVLVVDDLVTAGDTKHEGIKVLEDSGLVVRDIIILVDRQQGGADELRRRGYNLHALYTLTDLLELYAATQRIDSGLHQEIRTYANLA